MFQSVHINKLLLLSRRLFFFSIVVIRLRYCRGCRFGRRVERGRARDDISLHKTNGFRGRRTSRRGVVSIIINTQSMMMMIIELKPPTRVQRSRIFHGYPPSKRQCGRPLPFRSSRQPSDGTSPTNAGAQCRLLDDEWRLTTRTHSWGGGKGGGDDDKRDDDDDNDADQLHARVDSVVVSRGGERESLSVLSFLLAIHRQRERRVCVSTVVLSSFHLLLCCCVVFWRLFERHFLFFSFFCLLLFSSLTLDLSLPPLFTHFLTHYSSSSPYDGHLGR